MTRRLAAAVALALVAAGCGESGPEATPVQRDAIAALVDADLSPGEERCVLEGLIETGIDPARVARGDVTGDEDEQLQAVALSCIDDLTRIPAVVQAFIDGAAEEGTILTHDEAVCALSHLDDPDPAAIAAGCLHDTTPPTTAPFSYGDDRVLDLLWEACDNGNPQACDELFLRAPPGSGYATFGRTCAGALPDGDGGTCFDELG